MAIAAVRTSNATCVPPMTDAILASMSILRKGRLLDPDRHGASPGGAPRRSQDPVDGFARFGQAAREEQRFGEQDFGIALGAVSVLPAGTIDSHVPFFCVSAMVDCMTISTLRLKAGAAAQ